jgi:phosphohistidine phosphatase
MIKQRVEELPMELILWRHAEAEAGGADLERALTGKGLKQAKRVGAWLRSRLPGDARVLVSPARRAQQTAAALTERFETAAAVGPGASPEEVLAAAGWPRDEGLVVVVGHQPMLGRVLARLLAGQDAEWSIKKGALWWLRLTPRPEGAEVLVRAVIGPDLVEA